MSFGAFSPLRARRTHHMLNWTRSTTMFSPMSTTLRWLSRFLEFWSLSNPNHSYLRHAKLTIFCSGNLARQRPASTNSHPSLSAAQMATYLWCTLHCQTSWLIPLDLINFTCAESLFWVIIQLFHCAIYANPSLATMVCHFWNFLVYSWCADLQHVPLQILCITASWTPTVFMKAPSAPLDFEKN